MRNLLNKNWLLDLPIRKKLYMVVCIIFTIIFALVGSGIFGMYTISGLRAFVNAEGLWSKSQKDSSYYLIRYSSSHDETDYQQVLDLLKIPLSEKTARLELEKSNPDNGVAFNEFINAGNHLKDAQVMINLFRWFRENEHIDEAINVWTEADGQINALIKTAEEIHQSINTGIASKEYIDKKLVEVHEINQKLSYLEDKFSFTLGKASRWAMGFFTQIMIWISVFMALIGFILIFFVIKSTTSTVSDLVQASAKVALGDLDQRVAIRSNDELGALSISFNKMTSYLQKQAFELKESNEQLIQSEKLSVLGEMAAGVTHELNQPLNGIKIICQSNTRDIEKNRFDQKAIAQDLNEIVTYVNKLAEIIDHVRIYSRRTNGMVKETVDINQVIENVFILQREQLKNHNIELNEDYSGDRCDVSGDQIRLEQIIMNFIVNARDAVNSSGKPDKKIGIKTAKVENNTKVFIEISDNGTGISDEIKKKIFQPFFTTKDPGKGTGLGLSIVNKIIEEHNGTIDLTSEAGEGTCIKVILPAVN